MQITDNQMQTACGPLNWVYWVGCVLLTAALMAGSISVFAESTDAEAEATTAPPVTQKRSQVAEMPAGVMQLDETVISGNQELPKVLYILPWREPQGLPDIEIQAEFTEAEVFRRLYPPAYRRELSYFETLRGIQQNISPDQEE